MGEGWHTITLGNHCLKIGSGATPRGGSQIYLTEGKHSLVRSQNVYNDGFKEAGLVYITEEEARKLDNVTLQSQDILLNITGDSVARCCLMDDDYLPGRVNQHVAIIRPNTSELESRFLRYVLISPSWQDKLLTMAASGATRNALTKVMIENLEMVVPEGINEQRAIAHILGTLDDKIELNRRMNETLEGIARALFKSWFIDFDPVRAKAQGRQPFGMDQETAALFPDQFEDSELGEIPKGWKIAKIGDITINVRDQYDPTNSSAVMMPYIGLEHMPKGCISLYDWSVSHDLASGKFRFQTCDVLFGKLRPYFHKVGVAPMDGICSTDILVVRPIDKKFLGYVSMLLSSKEVVDYADRTSKGTKMPRTSWIDLANYNIALPKDELVHCYDVLASVLLERILHNINNNNILKSIRDFLLPGLISGSILVDPSKFGFGPEGEKVGEV